MDRSPGERTEFLKVKDLLKPVRTIAKTRAREENEFEAIKLRKTETVHDKSQSNILHSNIGKENEFCKVKLRKTEQSLTNNENENQSSKSKFREKNFQNNSKENISRSSSVHQRKKSLESQEIIQTDVREDEVRNIQVETICRNRQREAPEQDVSQYLEGRLQRRGPGESSIIYLLQSPVMFSNSRCRPVSQGIADVFSRVCLFCCVCCDGDD